MDRGIIINAGGAGGASLNYKVVGGTTAPENPANNTIWVNTETAITSYAFSATEPTSPIEGMVWFKTTDSSEASFNMLKKNAVIIHPVACSQYYNGTWETKTAQIYQNEWKNIGTAAVYLFNHGEINDELTGGIYYPELKDDAIHFKKDGISGGTTYTYSTKSKVDLTNYRTMKAKCLSGNSLETVIFRICVIDKTANGAHFTTSQLVASASEYGPFNDIERIAELDISELSGEYYLGYAFGVRSSATAGNIENDVYEWWLE